jgi:hypothetical protein
LLGIESIPSKKNAVWDYADSSALGMEEASGTGFDRILYLVELIRLHTNHNTEFCILIHNIDGSELQSNQAQLALSMLADCRFIHIIATVDNINAQLCMFFQCMCS